MANYQQLKNALVDVIKQNGNNEITGGVLQTTLLSMINSLGANYQFAGILTPSTSFVSTDENIFYIGGAGSYSNFGATTINVPTGCICIFTYNGSFASSILYVGGVVDVSRLTNTSYASLSQALADVPSYMQIGGLEIMYQDSTSGNYVKYRLMSASWSTTENNWQGVDKQPTANSINLLESGGVYDILEPLDATVNGREEVIIDVTQYDLYNGMFANGEFNIGGNYGLYHRCKFIPIGQYKGRTIRIVKPTNASYSDIAVLKSMPIGTTSQHIDYATGFTANILVNSSTSPYQFVVSEDAECLYIYVTDTRQSVDYTPSLIKVLSVQGLVGNIYTKEEIDEKETIIHQDTRELSNPTSQVGYVSDTQTIGQTVVLNQLSGYGNIYCYNNIPANSVITINFSSQTGAYGFALCDENDKVIEYCANTGLTSYTFAQTNVKTKLYASSTKLTNAICVTIQIESVKDAVTELQEEVSAGQNYWRNKKLWWCGTSIPAGSDATLGSDATIAGNYPTEVANDLNAIVFNVAEGGSMCRANVRTGDYVGANFANITSCLSMTKEEVEDFIENYATIKEVLTGNVPATLSASDIARLRAASFEDRLLPYLDGTYDMPDLFVLDHGHNDFKYTLSGGGTDIGLQPTVANIGNELAEDTFMTANNNAKLTSFFGSLDNIPSEKKAEFIASVNRNCFIGAMNFIITLILRYNPHARIMLVSNYEFENGATPYMSPLINAQNAIAKSWAFPICNVYEYLGYSNHIIPSSMAWFNATYPNVTPATTDITVYRAYLPDTVHPHSDITGDANNIYAGILSNFIRKIGE